MPKIAITDLSLPEIRIYTERAEGALYRAFEPAPGLFIAESERVIRRALHAGFEPVSALVSEMLADNGLFPETIPVYTAPEKVLEQITGYHLTGGMLCAMRRKKTPSVSELLADARRIVVLEGVMNPTNVGAIFRNAAALSMDAVLLSGGCADPLYRRAVRVSMGSVFRIPWTVEEDISAVHGALQKTRFTRIALALTNDAVSIEDIAVPADAKIAVFLGAEGDGLSPTTIKNCEYVARIPMAEGVDSLNVAAASALAFWVLRRQG